jgi:hypothetical protein
MSPSMNNEELLVLDDAFRIACAELRIAANNADIERLMRLSKIVISIANEGESDPAEIARRAVFQMQHPNEELQA